MKKNKFISISVILAVLMSFGTFLYFSSKTEALTSVSNVTGYAQIKNANKIYFNGQNGGNTANIPFAVTYDDATGKLSGFGWSEDYGWLDFRAGDATINITTGALTGKAKLLSFQNPGDAESPEWADGWVSFSGSNGGDDSWPNISYKVIFDIIGTGNADAVYHWAWGGNVVGWVDFSNVKVGEKVPSIDLNASPNLIGPGDSSLLSWSGANIVSCSGSGDWNYPSLGISNTFDTGALANIGIYTFDISCVGTNGATVTDSATVEVHTVCHDSTALNDGEPGDCVYSILPILDFVTDDSNNTTLSWNNALGCTINPLIPATDVNFLGWNVGSTLQNPSGTVPLGIVSATTIFSINCGGNGSASVCVPGYGVGATSCKKIPGYIET